MTLDELAQRLRAAFEKLSAQDPEIDASILWGYVAKEAFWAVARTVEAETPYRMGLRADEIHVGKLFRGNAERYPYRNDSEGLVHRIVMVGGMHYRACGAYVKRGHVTISPAQVTCLSCLVTSEVDHYPTERDEPVGPAFADRWVP